MTGTGRRRKPSSEDEEPRPAEESATTWSTYAPPPEPDYSYDWRREAAAGPGSEPAAPYPAAPYSGGPYPDGPPPGPSAGPASVFGAASASSPQFPPVPPVPPVVPAPGGPSGYPSSSSGSSAYPSSGSAPSAYPSSPPSATGSGSYPPPSAVPGQVSGQPYAQPFGQPQAEYQRPVPPAAPAYSSSPPPATPPSYTPPSYTPPPAADGFFAPRTFEQPPPYVADEPATGPYSPAGYQPSRYSPPDSQASSSSSLSASASAPRLSRTPQYPSADAAYPAAPADTDIDGLFDADALFDPEPTGHPGAIAQPSPAPSAPLSDSASSASASTDSLSSSFASSSLAADPAPPRAKFGVQNDPQPGTESDPDRKPTKIGSSASDFAFVEEETDSKEIAGWLTFVESRAESRAERARRMRNRLIAAGAAVALAAGGTLAYLWATGSPLLSSTTQPTKDVILLQVCDNTSGDAVADAVLAAARPGGGSSGGSGASGATAPAASTGHGAAVLIPSQMVVTGIGSGTQPFSGDMTANPPVPPAGANAVADSLGVQVDAVWSMDETTFAAMIDLFGGVTLTTDAAVPAVTAPAAAAPTATATGKSGSSGPTGSSGTSGSSGAPGAGTVTSAAIPEGGNEKLDGDQAMAYALYQGPGESIGAQVSRFGQVLDALLAELPTQEDLVNSYLNQLGVVPDPSLPQAKLAGILAQMAAEQQAGQFAVKALPLQANATDQLDFSAAGPIISSLLGGTVQSGLASGGTARILVDDATGTSGGEDTLLQSSAQAKLISAGYSYVGSTVVGKKSKSVIEIPTGSDQSAAGEVAETLNLPTSDIQVVSGMSEISDVTVVLGTDWIQTGVNG